MKERNEVKSSLLNGTKQRNLGKGGQEKRKRSEAAKKGDKSEDMGGCRCTRGEEMETNDTQKRTRTWKEDNEKKG